MVGTLSVPINHQPLTIDPPPEVLRIAAYIRQSFTSEEQSALKERLDRLDDHVHGMMPWERATERLPCAMLVEGRCSIYPVRPFPCMGWNSLDAGKCKRA